MKTKLLSSVLALVAFEAEAVVTLAAPNSFSSGTAISSSLMNANFTSIQSFVNGSVCLIDGTNCAYTGTVTNVVAGAGLTGGPITTSGTLAVDVGTTANKIVQLNAAAKLPPVDGSLLTNVVASSLIGTLSISQGGTGATTPATARANLGVPWDVAGADISYTAGNVGIGALANATIPLYVLYNGANPATTGLSVNTVATTASSGAGLDFRTDSGANRIARLMPSKNAPGGDLQFQNSSDGSTFVTTMVLTKGGNIGMGNLAPAYNLSINNPGSQVFSHFTNVSTGNTGTDGLLVGVNGTDAFIKYQENFPIRFFINGTEKMQIATNGDILSQTGLFNTLSDERLKKDFAPVTDVFKKLSQLHAYTYVLKKDKSKRKFIGVKAQEVEKAFPEIVSTGKDGLKSVAYPNLTAPLIDGVNILNERVTKLEEENEQLKAYICAKDAAAPFCK